MISHDLPQVWWTPCLTLGGCAIVLRFLLLFQLCRVFRDFGAGLAQWTGPTTLSGGLFAAMTEKQRAACDIM